VTSIQATKEVESHGNQAVQLQHAVKELSWLRHRSRAKQAQEEKVLSQSGLAFWRQGRESVTSIQATKEVESHGNQAVQQRHALAENLTLG